MAPRRSVKISTPEKCVKVALGKLPGRRQTRTNSLKVPSPNSISTPTNKTSLDVPDTQKQVDSNTKIALADEVARAQLLKEPVEVRWVAPPAANRRGRRKTIVSQFFSAANDATDENVEVSKPAPSLDTKNDKKPVKNPAAAKRVLTRKRVADTNPQKPKIKRQRMTTVQNIESKEEKVELKQEQKGRLETDTLAEDTTENKQDRESCTFTPPMNPTGRRGRRKNLSLRGKRGNAVDKKSPTIHQTRCATRAKSESPSNELPKTSLNPKIELPISPAPCIILPTSPNPCNKLNKMQTDASKVHNAGAVDSRKTSISSASYLSWTRDISSSSTTTCLTVSSNDVVRFNKKMPVVKLTNIDSQVDKYKYIINDNPSSAVSETSCDVRTSPIHYGSPAKVNSLNLSSSSRNSIVTQIEEEDLIQIDFSKSAQNLANTLKKIDLEFINWIQETDYGNSNLTRIKSTLFDILRNEFCALIHCRNLQDISNTKVVSITYGEEANNIDKFDHPLNQSVGSNKSNPGERNPSENNKIITLETLRDEVNRVERSKNTSVECDKNNTDNLRNVESNDRNSVERNRIGRNKTSTVGPSTVENNNNHIADRNKLDSIIDVAKHNNAESNKSKMINRKDEVENYKSNLAEHKKVESNTGNTVERTIIERNRNNVENNRNENNKSTSPERSRIENYKSSTPDLRIENCNSRTPERSRMENYNRSTPDRSRVENDKSNTYEHIRIDNYKGSPPEHSRIDNYKSNTPELSRIELKRSNKVNSNATDRYYFLKGNKFDNFRIRINDLGTKTVESNAVEIETNKAEKETITSNRIESSPDTINNIESQPESELITPSTSGTVPNKSNDNRRAYTSSESGDRSSNEEDFTKDDPVNTFCQSPQDDDDALSLYAESITGIESSRINTSALSPPNEKQFEEYVPKPIQDNFVSPKGYTYCPTKISDQKNGVVKTVCEKQNADSTSIYKDKEGNNVPPIYEKPPSFSESAESNQQFNENSDTHIYSALNTLNCPYKRPVIADLYQPKPKQSNKIFKGYCYLNLLSRCNFATKFSLPCPYPHKIPSKIEIKTKFRLMSEEDFIREYALLRRRSCLLSMFGMCFIHESVRRQLTRVLVEIAFDFLVNGKSSVLEDMQKFIAVETTLSHLNTGDLCDCEDLLLFKIDDDSLLCDVFMQVLTYTQNFSRFKSIFLNLTYFMVNNDRTFSAEVAGQILERVSILPFEEPLVRAVIQIIRLTSSEIFLNSRIKHFENLIENSDVMEEYLSLKRAVDFEKLARSVVENRSPKPMVDQPPMVHPDAQPVDHAILGQSVIQPLMIKTVDPPLVVQPGMREGVPMPPSPDTTHLDNMNKAAEDTMVPKITRTIWALNSTPTSHAAAVSPNSSNSENIFQTPNHNNWRNRSIFQHINRANYSSPRRTLRPPTRPSTRLLRPPIRPMRKGQYNHRLVTIGGSHINFPPPGPDF